MAQQSTSSGLRALVSRRARAQNYGESAGPRFVGSHAPAAPAAALEALHVVTLNIQFGRRIDRAMQLFSRVEELGRADIVLLQEVDATGTDAIAAHLAMRYVYYPATVHPRTGRDFGNAVLSRFPIAYDRKLALPHPSLRDGSQRTATCATLTTPLGRVEVCSTHLATLIELSPSARRAQMRAVLDGLRGAERVILGGDFNSHGLGRLVGTDAFDWPTRDIGGTVHWLSVDHLFARGLRAQRVGKVSNTRGTTDHAAVWGRLAWRY